MSEQFTASMSEVLAASKLPRSASKEEEPDSTCLSHSRETEQPMNWNKQETVII